MDGEPACDFVGCGEVGTIVSRLSPEGYLVATGKKAYSFREAYRRFHYCQKCHDNLMNGVWPCHREHVRVLPSKCREFSETYI